MSAFQTKTAFTDDTFKTYIEVNSGIAEKTAKYLIDDEGIKGFEEFSLLTNTKDWESIGKYATQAGFTISRISMMKLSKISVCAWFYKLMKYPWTEENMVRVIVEEVFETFNNWAENRADCKSRKLSKLKTMKSLISWLEHKRSELDDMVAPSGIPVSYLLRHNGSSPNLLPDLLKDKAYCEQYPSVAEMIINLCDHNHPLRNIDNRFLFDKLNDSWTGAGVLTSSSSAVREKKDGKALFNNALLQHGGFSQWTDLKEHTEGKLKSAVYDGTGNQYLFSKHANDYRDNSALLKMAAKQPNIVVTVPSDKAQAVAFLKTVEDVVDLSFRMRADGLSQDIEVGNPVTFEDVVSKLNVVCPVKKRRSRDDAEDTTAPKKRRSAHTVSSTIKSGIGKTGVPLRWLPVEEYKALSEEQHKEHKQWVSSREGHAAFAAQKEAAGVTTSRRRGGGGRGGGGRGRGAGRGRGRGVQFRRAVSAAVKTELEKINENHSAQVSSLTDVCKSALSAFQASSASKTATNNKQANVASTGADFETIMNQHISSLLSKKKSG